MLANTKTIKIPITVETDEEIQNYFPTYTDQKRLRSVLMNTIKTITSNVSAALLTQQASCTISKAEKLTRQDVKETFPITKDILDKYIEYVKENPNWFPKNITSNTKYFELDVEGFVYGKLKLGAKLLCFRIEKYNESLKATPEELEKFKVNPTTSEEEQKQSIARKEAFEKATKIKSNEMITCFEDFIYEQLHNILIGQIMQSIDKKIDVGFEELYPNESPKNPKPSR